MPITRGTAGYSPRRMASFNVDLPDEIVSMLASVPVEERREALEHGAGASGLIEVALGAILLGQYEKAVEKVLRTKPTKYTYYRKIDDAACARLGLTSQLLHDKGTTIAKYLGDAFGVGYRSISGDLPVVDRGLLHNVTNAVVYWARAFYGNNIRDRLKEAIRNAVIHGAPQVASAKAVFGRASKNIVRTSSIYTNLMRGLGSLRAFKDMGIRYFQFNALPGHCEICGIFDKKVFPVEKNYQILYSAANSHTPASIKDLMPFVVDVDTARRLFSLGVCYIPMHPNCRCYYSIVMP